MWTTGMNIVHGLSGDEDFEAVQKLVINLSLIVFMQVLR